MKRILIHLIFFLAGAGSFEQALPVKKYIPTSGNLEARKQFQDMKFGLFIHWGASSVLGDGEWVMNNRNINLHDYEKLLSNFNPQAFDAKKWVTMAREAGMKYITFITRHHDGFSNWDTHLSNWKITSTPFGKDALQLLAKECHAQGIKLFCYYSLVDWYRSDYQYETGNTGKGTGRTEKSNWNNYIQFMKAQLTELLTGYGDIAGIWFDGFWDQLNKNKVSQVDWHINEIYDLIHKLQPSCLVGNNHHLSPLAGEDFQMFEKDLPGENTTGWGSAAISQLPLETCETMNNSWGFNITDRNYKTVKQIIHLLVNAAGRNANFLLNAGPMGNGEMQPEFIDTLAEVGKWMKQNGETICNTRGNIVKPAEWGVITATGKTHYVHLLDNTKREFIFISGIKDKVKNVKLFSNNKRLNYKQQPEGVFIFLDGIEIDKIDTIIQMDVE